MSEQWFVVAHCTECDAPLYELHYPTCVGWNPTGTRRWRDGDPTCNHHLEANEDEICTSADNRLPTR